MGSNEVSLTERTGRSVVFHRPGVPLEIRDINIPHLQRGDVLVRVDLAGICGTDHHRLKGDVAWVGHSVCFGHEAVGTIIEVGGDPIDSNGVSLAVGDRVYWCASTPCGECTMCRAGVNMSCERMVWPAPADRANPAAFQQLAHLGPLVGRFRVPVDVSDDVVIAMGCGLPTAITGFERLGSISGTVVILGAGPVGLASTVLASLAGAERVIVVGDPAERLDAARRFGATDVIPLTGAIGDERHQQIVKLTSGGRGADLVIEAAGHPSAFPDGFELLGPSGRFLILGLYSGSGAAAPVDPVRINNLNLQIIGSLSMEVHAFGRAVALAAEHGERLGFARLITHRFGLDETEVAIATVARGEAVKAVIEPNR
ncbi:zinc-binding dehydrogenase [Arthrobacter sp. NPDC080073]|uniref:zinc-binding dehydrogenase n=1 Tax=Arthrobacter sp. NPDC080073 TaxID=3155919 RepID=UPI003433E9C3